MPHVTTSPITPKGILLALLVTCDMYAISAPEASGVAEAGIAGREAAASQQGARRQRPLGGSKELNIDRK